MGDFNKKFQPHCQLLGGICSSEYRRDRYFYIAFNNVTNFIKGLRNVKILKVFFSELDFEPSLTFKKKVSAMPVLILKCRVTTLKQVKVASTTK